MPSLQSSITAAAQAIIAPIVEHFSGYGDFGEVIRDPITKCILAIPGVASVALHYVDNNGIVASIEDSNDNVFSVFVVEPEVLLTDLLSATEVKIAALEAKLSVVEALDRISASTIVNLEFRINNLEGRVSQTACRCHQ